MGPTKILADSYRFSASNLIQITSLCLPFIFASALFGNVLEQLWTGGWLLGEYIPLIVDLFIYPIYGGALIVFIERRTRGESPSNLEILSATASIWLPLFVLTVIGTTLFLVGLFLLVIPGIWVLVKLAFSEYLLVLTRATPLDAIRQSFELTKGRFWPVFNCMIAVVGPIWILSFVLDYSAKQIGSYADLKIAIETATNFLALFLIVVLFRVFMLMSESEDDDES